MRKGFIDQYHRLDIRSIPRELNKKGYVFLPKGYKIELITYQDHITVAEEEIYIDTQNTGYGSKRFFVCPYCGESRQYLYYHNNTFKCRFCANLRYRCTNEYKDGFEPIDRKIKGICDKLKVENYLDYLNLENRWPPKPYKMRWKTYSDLIFKLRFYQTKRGEKWLECVARNWNR